MKLTAFQIAFLIHQVTSQIPRPDGSKVSPWAALPESAKQNAANAVKELMLTPLSSPKEHHDLWMRPLLEDGWTRGEYSAENKTHPCICEFEELIPSEQLKDELWQSLIEVFSKYYSEEDGHEAIIAHI